MAVSTIGGNIYAAGVLTASLTPASVAANITVEQSFTVNGVKSGDFVVAVGPSITAGVGLPMARVTAANTVAITFQNSTSGAVVPPAGSYQFLVVRPEVTNASSFAP